MKKFILALTLLFAALASHAEGLTNELTGKISATQKIYYLLAAPQGSGRSMAGHAYLRLGNQAQPSPDDLVIEFVADAPADLSYWKALGFGTPYDRSIVVDNYRHIQYAMNLVANRNLKSYELKLDDAKRAKFLNRLLSLIHQGKMGQYTFLSANCAEAVSELFSLVGIDLSWPISVVPAMIPGSLLKKNLVQNVFEDLSLTQRREALVVSYPLLKNIFPNSVLKSLVSADIYQRVSALLQIHQDSRSLEPDSKFKIKTFLLSASFLESRFLRGDLIGQFNGKKNFDLGRLQTQSWDLRPALEREFGSDADRAQVTIQNSHLQIKNGQFKISHAVTLKSAGRSAGSLKKINLVQDLALSGLRLQDDRLFLNERQIGHLVSSEIKDEEIILTEGWIQSSLSQQNGKISITSLVLTEAARESRKQDLSYSDESFLKNNNPDMPMCFGLVELQKLLLENVLWDPQEKPLTAFQNLDLVRRLMNQEIVVVPGFQNAREWTQSLPQAPFKQMIFKLHQERYSNLTSALKVYSKQILVTEKNLNFLLQKARLGIYTPLFFKTKFGVGHAILLTGMTGHQGNKYQIQAYDPNILSASQGVTGFSGDIFEVDAKTGKIKSFGYGESEAFFMVDYLNSEYQNRDLMANPDAQALIKIYAKKTGRHAFSLNDFSTAF